MTTEFLTSLIKKYHQDDVQIYISDANARILASTEEDRVGTYGSLADHVTDYKHALSIKDMSSIRNDDSHYGIPVIINGIIKYVIVVYGNTEHTVHIGETIHAALQTTLEFQEYQKQKANRIPNELNEISSLMLSLNPDKEKLYFLMQRNNLVINQPRFVLDIYINFPPNNTKHPDDDFKKEAQKLKDSMTKELKKSRYYSTQDLFYAPDIENLLIIKSTEDHEDSYKTYEQMERIYKDFVSILDQIEGLSYSITYGDFFNTPENMYQSHTEACKIARWSKMHPEENVHNLNHVFEDYIAMFMRAELAKRYLRPAEKRLFQEDGNFQYHLLTAAETFVDHQYNLSATASALHMHRNTVASHLKQFTALTGIDPGSSFQDAFLTKMLAICVKHTDYYKSSLSILSDAPKDKKRSNQ